MQTCPDERLPDGAAGYDPMPPTPADEGPDCKATEAFERCTSILAEGEPAANVDSLSLGNADGFPGASEGGYVYLSGLSMDVTGSVKISAH